MKNIRDDEPVLFQVEKLSEYVDDPEPMGPNEGKILQSDPDKPFRFVISAEEFEYLLDELSEEFDDPIDE